MKGISEAEAVVSPMIPNFKKISKQKHLPMRKLGIPLWRNTFGLPHASEVNVPKTLRPKTHSDPIIPNPKSASQRPQ